MEEVGSEWPWYQTSCAHASSGSGASPSRLLGVKRLQRRDERTLMLVSIWLTVWPPSSMITSYPPEFLESASIWSNSFWSAWSPAWESSFYALRTVIGKGLRAGPCIADYLCYAEALYGIGRGSQYLRAAMQSLTDVQGAACLSLDVSLVLCGARCIVLQVGHLGVGQVLLPHLQRACLSVSQPGKLRLRESLQGAIQEMLTANDFPAP